MPIDDDKISQLPDVPSGTPLKATDESIVNFRNPDGSFTTMRDTFAKIKAYTSGGKEDIGVAQSLINTHNASADPHPQYTVTESGDYPTSNYYTDRYRVLTQGGITICDDVPRMGKVVAVDENSPLTLDKPWFVSFGVLNQSIFTVYNFGTEPIELIASPEVYFNLYLDVSDRSVALKPNQSALFVRTKLLNQDLCYSVFLNKEGTVARTGDYYVHAQTGQDTSANGTISSPYKTIQYAIANVPPNNTIKILKGDYYFTGEDALHYDGTIELQGAVIHVNLDAGRYLIFYTAKVHIKGDGTIQIETADNRFLSHTNNTLCKIEGIKVLFQNQTEGPILIQNTGIKEFKNCTFSLYPNYATANIQLFNEEDLVGADFNFNGCGFSGLKLKFRNYSSNGGATIKGSTFYGTSTFNNQDNFIQVGRGLISTRILLIEDTSFDMVTLGLLTSKAIYLDEVGTEITLRNVRFIRYTGVDRYSIYTDQQNCKVYAFNCTTSTPTIDVSLASNMQILPVNEFKYFDNLPTYVR